MTAKKSEDDKSVLFKMMIGGLSKGSDCWPWHFGLPAKSGVGGGIAAAARGRGGIALSFGTRHDFSQRVTLANVEVDCSIKPTGGFR